ncbi:uncharacterized protein LOC116024429 [Ipomoea triloba]|uniref:uncharacterized protein LOC116024429 n=1 Tax=Ipomoea triloba TaxID=35885 RepID=UPI00125DC53B|nr:uncharacterized protein LOC116024429 [Ipomoea triloba]
MGMYCLANELTTFKKRCAIKVRVVRAYIVMERRGSSEIKSKELVLHDEEATVLHAHIPKDVLPKFCESFVEGNVYCIKNFYVVSNWHTYKTSMHEFMLQFNHETIMKEYRSDNFPYHMYRSRPFHTLKGNPTVNVKELIDLIGRVVEIHAPQEKRIGGQNTRLIDFVLEDAQSASKEHVVVLIQFCRIKLGASDGDVKISSSYDVTQLLFDVDCPEMQNFKESLLDIGEQTPMRSIGSMTSFSYTNSIDDSTSQAMELKTISDIYENEMHGEFWVAAKINCIDNPNDWFYSSCRKTGCNKKLKVSEGIPASELYERNKNIIGPLKEITDIVGRIMLFKISAKTDQFINRYYAFPVLRINNETKFVQQYCKQLLDAHLNDSNCDLEISDGDDEFLQGFDSEEAESPIAMLPPNSAAETSDGPVKRCLLDQFSSTKGCKKMKDTKVKIEKID